jgi:hypothetical protein
LVSEFDFVDVRIGRVDVHALFESSVEGVDNLAFDALLALESQTITNLGNPIALCQGIRHGIHNSIRNILHPILEEGSLVGREKLRNFQLFSQLEFLGSEAALALKMRVGEANLHQVSQMQSGNVSPLVVFDGNVHVSRDVHHLLDSSAENLIPIGTTGVDLEIVRHIRVQRHGNGEGPVDHVRREQMRTHETSVIIKVESGLGFFPIVHITRLVI